MSSKLALLFATCLISTKATHFTIINECNDTLTISAIPPLSGYDGNIVVGTLGPRQLINAQSGPDWLTGEFKTDFHNGTTAYFTLDVYQGYDTYNINTAGGFNYPLQISPSEGCLEITCNSPNDCGPFPLMPPFDNKGSAACPNGASYNIIYCPGGEPITI